MLKDPVIGIRVAISPRLFTTKNMEIPATTYAIRAPMAPAAAKVVPEVTSKPVPTRVVVNLGEEHYLFRQSQSSVYVETRAFSVKVLA